MDDEHNDNISDSEQFRRAMAKVKPLKVKDKIIPACKAGNYAKKQREQYRREQAQQSSETSLAELSPNTPFNPHIQMPLYFYKPGVQQRLYRKLVQGNIPREARLDTHGMSGEQMIKAVSQLIDQCVQQSRRCALVIHGKGLRSKHKHPIIKSLLAQYLNTHPQVLACCKALDNEGGSGACYILLKSN